MTADLAHAAHWPGASEAPVSLDDYQLRLEGFEGPLDVLLRLIERERLAIADVSLVAVTDGFLAYVRDLRDAPPLLLAEFASVAGRLLVLKSRSLLPRPPAAIDEQEPSDLARQLTEHRALRDVAIALGELDRLGLGSFPLGAAVQRPAEPDIRIARHPPLALANAIRRRLAGSLPVKPMPARTRVVSLAEMVRRLVERLQGASSIRFCDVLSSASARDEALAGFLAVLVLIRRKVAHVDQSDLFGPIEIRLAAGTPAALLADLLDGEKSGFGR